jgi:hypothetical protein
MREEEAAHRHKTRHDFPNASTLQYNTVAGRRRWQASVSKNPVSWSWPIIDPNSVNEATGCACLKPPLFGFSTRHSNPVHCFSSRLDPETLPPQLVPICCRWYPSLVPTSSDGSSVEESGRCGIRQNNWRWWRGAVINKPLWPTLIGLHCPPDCTQARPSDRIIESWTETEYPLISLRW